MAFSDTPVIEFTDDGVSNTVGELQAVDEVDVETFMPHPVHELGVVQLLDVMGDDLRIVEAARVSVEEGRAKKYQDDRSLIRYLMRHDHGTPFEMVVFHFYVKCPIFVARQWMRHRISSFNERSGRYTEFDEEFFVPSLPDLNPRSRYKKQGRDEGKSFDTADAQIMRQSIENCNTFTHEHYQALLRGNLAPELARIVLPLSSYTEFRWNINLRSLFNFLNLRLRPDAQKEIRAYAGEIAKIVTPLVPLSMEAFGEYVFRATNMANWEMALLRQALTDAGVEIEEEYPEEWALERGISKGEWKEFVGKMKGQV